MEREKLILNIEALYPTDCKYADTNAIGKVLLQQAIDNTKYDWRDMPLIVLEEYHRLCVDEEINGETTMELRKMTKEEKYYEEMRKAGLTDAITSNSEPNYKEPFYQAIFRIMSGYSAHLTAENARLREAIRRIELLCIGSDESENIVIMINALIDDLNHNATNA